MDNQNTNPIDLYAIIQPMVKLEVDNAIKDYADKSKYGIFPVVAHAHNGVDSQKINYNELLNLPASNTIKYFISSTSRTSGSGGTQSITGVGFVPKYIRINAYSAGSNGGLSLGSSNIVTSSCLERYFNVSWLSTVNNTNIICVRDNSGSQSKATLSTLDTDGFTINWDTVATTVGFNYECIG